MEVNKTPPDNEWQLVKKRAKEKPKPRTMRERADALVIKTSSDKSYAVILKKVKNDPVLKGLGDNVTRIRHIQKGEMLFELKKDTAVNSSEYKKLVEKSIGEEGEVRVLTQVVAVKCRGLNEITTEEELRSALDEQLGTNTVSQSASVRIMESLRVHSDCRDKTLL